MKKEILPLSRVYGLLEPGPVVLLSTALGEKTNVMTMSWQTMLDFEPPLLACVVSENNYSFDFLVRSRECVINIPTEDLAEKVVGCGNTSGRSTEKFARFSLSAAPASEVSAPLIEECYACLECRLRDDRMVETYNLFILEVVKAWIDPSYSDPRTLHHRGEGAFMVAGRTIRLPSKMK